MVEDDSLVLEDGSKLELGGVCSFLIFSSISASRAFISLKTASARAILDAVTSSDEAPPAAAYCSSNLACSSINRASKAFHFS